MITEEYTNMRSSQHNMNSKTTHYYRNESRNQQLVACAAQDSTQQQKFTSSSYYSVGHTSNGSPRTQKKQKKQMFSPSKMIVCSQMIKQPLQPQKKPTTQTNSSMLLTPKTTQQILRPTMKKIEKIELVKQYAESITQQTQVAAVDNMSEVEISTIIQNPFLFFKDQGAIQKFAGYESVSPIKQEVTSEQSHSQKIESIRYLISKTSALTSPTNKNSEQVLREQSEIKISKQFFNDGDNALETEIKNSSSPFRLKIKQIASGPPDDTELSYILNESSVKNVIEMRTNKKTFIKDVQQQKDSFLYSSPTQQLDLQNSSNKVQIDLELNMRLQKMKEISGKLFQQNLFLRCIDLRNNAISKLPENICELSSLWKLRLDYNNLVELPQGVGFLRKLEFLTVSQNRLSCLPKSLFTLGSKLQVLCLNDNRFTSLSSEIAHLSGLKILLLHNNYLSELPSQLCNLQLLREFSLDWFYYLDESRQSVTKTNDKNQKILKDETGKIIISEFLNFFSLMHSNLKKIEEGDTAASQSKQQVLFVQFLMYFHKLNSLSDLKSIKFNKSKNRGLLHSLSLNGYLYLIKHLFLYCDHLDVNQADQEMSTPIILALKNKKLEVVKYFISLPQTNINKGSKKFGCPLHVAIEFHEFKMAMKLLKSGDSSQYYKFLDVNSKNEDGNNAMHLLFINFNVKPEITKVIAKTLIKRGININAKNKNNLTPLHLACHNNQFEAILFALEHNKLIYQYKQYNNIFMENDLNLFNFNEKGGNKQYTCLHIAARSTNNQRLLMTLLQSREQLDIHAIDEEGHQPKDICPYNSPMYKSLVNYERLMLRNVFSNAGKVMGLSIEDDHEIFHSNISTRNYESPTQVRKRIIEKATQKEQAKLMNQQHTGIRNINNTMKKVFGSERFSTINNAGRHSYLIQSDVKKSDQEGLIFSQPDELQFESYYLKQDINEYVRKPRTFRSHIRNSTISDVDTTSRASIQFNENHNLKATNKQDCSQQVMDYLKKSEERKRREKKSNCSSFNGSRCSDRQDSPNYQTVKQSEPFIKAHIQCSNSLAQSLVQPIPYQNDDLVINSTLKPLIFDIESQSFDLIKQDSDKEKIDEEEDDANIPEDIDDHINASQIERPNSQLKNLTKSQSLYIDRPFPQDGQNLIQNIIQEITKQKQKIYMAIDSSNSPDQQLPIISQIPVIQPQQLLNMKSYYDTFEEQGQVADLSINEESNLAVRNPPNQETLSPRFAVPTYKDLQNRLSQETPKPKQFHQSYDEYFATMLGIRCSALSPSDFNISEGEYLSLQTRAGTTNLFFLLDKAYYSLHFLPVNLLIKLINALLQQQYFLPNTVTKKFKELLLYEFINSITVKIDQNKRRRASQINYKRKLTLEEGIPKIGNKNLLGFQSTPTFKVFFKKSPSVSILHQEVPVHDFNVSPEQRKTERELHSTFLKQGIMTPKLVPLQVTKKLVERERFNVNHNNSDYIDANDLVIHQEQSPIATQFSTQNLGRRQLDIVAAIEIQTQRTVFARRSLSQRGIHNRKSAHDQSPEKQSNKKNKDQSTFYGKYKQNKDKVSSHNQQSRMQVKSKMSKNSQMDRSGLVEMKRLLQQSRNFCHVKADLNIILIETESLNNLSIYELGRKNYKNNDMKGSMIQFSAGMAPVDPKMNTTELDHKKCKNIHDEKMQMVSQSAIRKQKMFQNTLGGSQGQTQRLIKNPIFTYNQNVTEQRSLNFGKTMNIDTKQSQRVSKIRKDSTITQPFDNINILSPNKPTLPQKPLSKNNTLKKNQSMKKINTKQFQNL